MVMKCTKLSNETQLKDFMKTRGEETHGEKLIKNLNLKPQISSSKPLLKSHTLAPKISSSTSTKTFIKSPKLTTKNNHNLHNHYHIIKMVTFT